MRVEGEQKLRLLDLSGDSVPDTCLTFVAKGGQRGQGKGSMGSVCGAAGVTVWSAHRGAGG